jgi:hypothetical protein
MSEQLAFVRVARLVTGQAEDYLAQVFEHLDEKAQARSEPDVRIEWSATAGTVDFGWSRCTMRATPTALELRVEARERDGLEAIQEFVARHVETHADDESPVVRWTDLGSSIEVPVDAGRRTHAMRQFHRRIRH